MSQENENLASRFRIEVGYDAETDLEVASVVRDDEMHVNLNLVNALIDLGQLHPAAFKSLGEMVYDLVEEQDEKGGSNIMN